MPHYETECVQITTPILYTVNAYDVFARGKQLYRTEMISMSVDGDHLAFILIRKCHLTDLPSFVENSTGDFVYVEVDVYGLHGSFL